VKMALHRREAVVHAVERIDTKAPVDVIGLIGVRQPDHVQVMKVDRVRLLRIEIGHCHRGHRLLRRAGSATS
jgi:hypothetical protein